jgi:DNA-binding Lrp family transcriptional regulator
LTLAEPSLAEVKKILHPIRPPFEDRSDQIELAKERLTRRSMHVLRLLCEDGNYSTFMTSHISQKDLAQKLQVTRQALSIHIRRLTESGFVQVGRGFVNVTGNGLRAVGYHSNPAILIIRLAPNKQLDAVERIKTMSAVEIFRVAGDADFAIIVEQELLDHTLAALYDIDGVIEIKKHIATEVIQRSNHLPDKRPARDTALAGRR